MSVSAGSSTRIPLAIQLMEQFAEATGLVGALASRRYLWTDALAVCNYLGFYRSTGNEGHLQAARRLIDEVHQHLGRHRADEVRQGWISGLSEAEGQRQPTRGGLRIGKRLPERPADEPFQESLEWERDGQYYHYLTKWMHALHCAARVTGDARYDQWAIELAIVTEEAFSRQFPLGTTFSNRDRAQSPRRLVWKMSIGLDRPQVESSGHHDPLDGLISAWELTRAATGTAYEQPLADVTGELRSMCEQGQWSTTDALGAGGLLFDAVRLSQLIDQGGIGEHELLLKILVDALQSLRYLGPRFRADEPASHRLAFRELGLSIGLHGLRLIAPLTEDHEAERYVVQALRHYEDLADSIESFWIAPQAREASTWCDHRDINTVMLATSLAPDGFFII